MNDTASAKPEEAGLGHNQPPQTVEERLLSDYGRLAKKVDALLTSTKSIGEITSDDDIKDATDFAVSIRRMTTVVNEFKDEELKEPTKTTRAVNKFFKAFVTALDKRKKELEDMATEFMEAEAVRKREERDAQEKAARDRAAGLRKQAEEGGEVLREAAENTAEKLEKDADRLGKQVKDADLVRTRSEAGSVATVVKYWDGELEDRDKIDLNELKKFFTDAEITKAIRGFVRDGGRKLKGAKITEKGRTQFR